MGFRNGYAAYGGMFFRSMSYDIRQDLRAITAHVFDFVRQYL